MKGGSSYGTERTVLDNPPSEETALKIADFFMRTLILRILVEMETAEEAKKKGDKKEVM